MKQCGKISENRDHVDTRRIVNLCEYKFGVQSQNTNGFSIRISSAGPEYITTVKEAKEHPRTTTVHLGLV